MACALSLLIMVLLWIQRAFGYALEHLTKTSSGIQLPSPPFLRWNGPTSPSLGQIAQNVVLEGFPFHTAPLVGIAVVVAWLVLFANGRFRPVRLGRSSQTGAGGVLDLARGVHGGDVGAVEVHRLI